MKSRKMVTEDSREEGMCGTLYRVITSECLWSNTDSVRGCGLTLARISSCPFICLMMVVVVVAARLSYGHR